MTTRRVPGIFCLEGNWKSDLARRDSVQPMLQMLNDVAGVRYIRRDVSTPEELQYLIERWSEPKYETYPVGYFAFHGTEGTIHLGDARVSLADLGRMLEGACAGKVIYFGACDVLDVDAVEIEGFRELTAAACVAGFKEKVYWIESAAFDMLFFEALTLFQKMSHVETWMEREHGAFCRKLGFKMHY